MPKYLVNSKICCNFARFFVRLTLRMVPSGRKPAKRLRTEKRSITRSVIQGLSPQSREC